MHGVVIRSTNQTHSIRAVIPRPLLSSRSASTRSLDRSSRSCSSSVSDPADPFENTRHGTRKVLELPLVPRLILLPFPIPPMENTSETSPAYLHPCMSCQKQISGRYWRIRRVRGHYFTAVSSKPSARRIATLAVCRPAGRSCVEQHVRAWTEQQAEDGLRFNALRATSAQCLAGR